MVEISEKTEEEVSRCLNRLIIEKMIIRSEEGFYLPSSPPENVTLSLLYSRLSGLKENKRKSVEDFYRGGSKELNNRTVSDLIKDNDKTDR